MTKIFKLSGMFLFINIVWIFGTAFSMLPPLLLFVIFLSVFTMLFVL